MDTWLFDIWTTLAIAGAYIAFYLTFIARWLLDTWIFDTEYFGAWLFDAWPTLTIAGAYIVFYFVARWFWIMRQDRSHLKGELENFETHMRLLEIRFTNDHNQRQQIELILQRTRRILEKVDTIPGKAYELSLYKNIFFYGAEFYMRHWREFHNLQLQAVEFDEVEKVKLRTLEPEALIGVPSSLEKMEMVRHLRRAKEPICLATLQAIADTVYAARDNYYGNLADWRNKAQWLIGITLFVIVIIALTRGEERMLLLFGSVGGLLAKLRGCVNRAELPVDYGLSWSTLLLTPLVGALTGWAGIQFLRMAISLNIFDKSMLNLICNDNVVIIALAILSGYSATFFDKLLENVQARVTKSR